MLARSYFLILVWKEFKLDFSLSHMLNLDHSQGPKYLIECLPFSTVLNLGCSREVKIQYKVIVSKVVIGRLRSSTSTS